VADTKISVLTAVTTPAGTDEFAVNQGGVSKKMTLAQIGAAVAGLVLLEQHTASSSASLDFTTCISSTYDEYRIEFIDVLPATDNVELYLRMSTNGGSSYDAGAAAYANVAIRWHSGNNGGYTGGTAAFIRCSAGDNVSNSATWGGVAGSLTLYNPASATAYKRVTGLVAHGDNTDAVLEQAWLSGAYLSTTAVNAFQFLFSSGNIASGTIRVYGIAKA